MPRKIHKSLQDYLSKLKKPTSHIQFPATNYLSSSINRMISGCKYPKTLSFDQTKSHGSSSDHSHAATLSDIDRFLFENFGSLYQKNDDDEDDDEKAKDIKNREDEEEKGDGLFLFESPRVVDPPLMNICSSHRFFTTPGSSSSLMEDARASLTASSDDIVDFSSSSSCSEIKEVLPPHDCIAVLMNSPNPYVDFRISMQEMIEARLHSNERVDWDFMEELLFCYLNLNDKDSHKHILHAFVDLIDVLRRNTERRSGEWSGKKRFEKEMKKVNVKFESSCHIPR